MAHCVNFGCLDGHGKNALFKLYQACWLVISTAGAVNLLWLWSYTPIQFKLARIWRLFFQMWLACLKNNLRMLYPQVGKKMFYHIVANSNMRYWLGNQGLKIPFISNLKRLSCTSKRDFTVFSIWWVTWQAWKSSKNSRMLLLL